MKKYELAIFDFDDTIGHLTVKWTDVKKEILKYAKNNGIRNEPKEHIIPLANRISETPEGKEFVVNTFRKYEKECTKNKTWLMFPSMILLLYDLKKSEHKLAIATGNNTKTIHEIIKAERLGQLFDFIVGMDSTKFTKPDPSPLNLILEKLNIKKENAIFIGNSEYDKLAGKNAGINTIIIRTLWEDDVYELRKKLL